MLKVDGSLLKSFNMWIGLKQGDALNPMLFHLILEYVIRKLDSVNEGLPLERVVKVLAFTHNLDLLCNNKDGLYKLFHEIQ